MIQAEKQAEDEITVNDRAIADHARRTWHALGCTRLISLSKNHQLKNSKMSIVEPSTTRLRTFIASCWLLISFSCALHLHNLIYHWANFKLAQLTVLMI
jgi:hypothetical protein